MKATDQTPEVKKGKIAGIRCEFKPPFDKRVIRFATAEQVKAASKWTNEKYAETFKQLAKS